MNVKRHSLASQQASIPSLSDQAIDFKGFGLRPALIAALDTAGLSRPTPIQQMAIPVLLKGRDLLALAQTGTGKTAAFLLPLLDHLCGAAPFRAGQAPRALILTPTRELASQIQNNIRLLTQDLNIRHLTIFGGTRYDKQIAGLKRGVDVVIATPGRLEDLMKRGVFDSKELCYFIMDEADHMLDLGFYPAMKRISETLPAARQTMLFSATMPPKIRKLASEFLVKPDEVTAPQTGRTAEMITQRIIILAEAEKRSMLNNLLAEYSDSQTLVFVRTKRRAEQLAKHMAGMGFPVNSLHGDMRQKMRENVLEKFRQGQLKTLIATDVAARGIDVSGIGLVVNFDLTDTPEAYIHRVGRTGRAGLSGLAISFCCNQEMSKLRDIRKLVGENLEISGEQTHSNQPSAAVERPGKTQSWPKKKKRQHLAKPKKSTAYKSVAKQGPSKNARSVQAPKTPTSFNPAEPVDEGKLPDNKRRSERGTPKSSSNRRNNGGAHQTRLKRSRRKPFSKKTSSRVGKPEHKNKR